MEDDSWAVSSSCSSRSHRSTTAIKYQSGSYLDFEGDYEEEEEETAVDYYQCPYCSDEYDLVELCHHIDEEHQLEANHGTCPVCSRRVKMHMVDHITTHHRDILKSGEKQVSSYGEEENSYYSSDKYLYSSKPLVNDQFLSFINNSTLPNPTKLLEQSDSSLLEENSLVKDSSIEKGLKSLSLSSPLSDIEQLEKANKCEFVQGLLASAMFNDE